MILFESTRYTAPNNPFLKFRSDLARELTAKKFPIWSYNKLEKKVFRSPATLIYRDAWILPYLTDDGKNLLCIRTKTDVLGWIESENNDGESKYVYQGPTWKIYGEGDNDFNENGLTRDQLADAIIELIEQSTPHFDAREIWGEMERDIKDSIEYYEQHDDERKVINLKNALEKPELPPDLYSSSGVDKKEKTWFGGFANWSSNGELTRWIIPAWSREDAIITIKKKYCSTRDYDGTRKEPTYIPSSVVYKQKFDSEEEAKSWKESRITENNMRKSFRRISELKEEVQRLRSLRDFRRYCKPINEAAEKPEEEKAPAVLKIDTNALMNSVDYYSCVKISRDLEDIILDTITRYMDDNDGVVPEEDIKEYLKNDWVNLITAIYERGTSEEPTEEPAEETEEVKELEDTEEQE